LVTFIKLLFWGVVAINLAVVSVPRCDLVFSALKASETSSGEHDHCGPKLRVKAKGAILGNFRICQCQIGKTLIARLEEIDQKPIALPAPRPIALIVYSYHNLVTQYASPVETPPPRA
jgi:hypothetical protein